VWQATLDGRALRFVLAGINNQNFIMRDEETGSWWQQVTGEAIRGPLRGKRLTHVPHDEITFGRWRSEFPGGRVLRPATDTAWITFSRDWEEETARYPVRIAASLDSVLAPREVVVGIDHDGRSRAYPLEAVRRQSPLHDQLGNVPIVIALARDGSMRGFDRRVNGQTLEFFARTDSTELVLVDGATGSVWDFTGRAASGSLAGARLNPVYLQHDYWFDWKTYHPATSVYRR
jgi:hypothetical protein